MEEDEEDVLYDIETCVLTFQVKETIKNIIDQIYVQKNLTPICRMLMFKRLLLRLGTDCRFTFSNSFYQQTDGCTLNDPLSVTFSAI